MGKIDFKDQAKEIYELIGKKENVKSYTNCMTRLRIMVKDLTEVNITELEKKDYILKIVVVENLVQIVIGPGKVEKVRSEIDVLIGDLGEEVITEEIKEDNKEEKSKKVIIFDFLQNVIMPAIGAIMAIGLTNALVNILKILGAPTDASWFILLKSIGGYGVTIFGVFFALNTAKYYKTNQYLAVALVLFTLNADNMSLITPYGMTLMAGAGGVIGSVLVVMAMSFVEKKIKKIVPPALNLLLVPFITFVISIFITMYLIVPVSVILTKGLMSVFAFAINSNPVVYILFSTLVGAIYPWLVLSGLHMSLMAIAMPIYVATGNTPLVAAAFLGGAAQLGTAYGVYLQNKKDLVVKEAFMAGAPSAFLGVVEPLLYGINLPRFKPLVLASVAAGIGGLLIGLTGLTMTMALPGFIGLVSFETVPQMIAYGFIWLLTAFFGTILVLIFYKGKEK